MNKYQELLDIIRQNTDYSDYSIKTINAVDEAYEELYKKIEELTKIPTLEEVKKEWEDLGYKIVRHERRELIFKQKEDGTIFTMWYFNNLCYSKYWNGTPESITLQEHKLLTKTFKALGWEM